MWEREKECVNVRESMEEKKKWNIRVGREKKGAK
jgi:hypothetical protein